MTPHATSSRIEQGADMLQYIPPPSRCDLTSASSSTEMPSACHLASHSKRNYQLTPLSLFFPTASSPARTAISQSTQHPPSAGASGSPASAVRRERPSSRSTRRISSPTLATGFRRVASSTTIGHCRRLAGKAPRIGSNGSSCAPADQRSASTHAWFHTSAPRASSRACTIVGASSSIPARTWSIWFGRTDQSDLRMPCMSNRRSILAREHERSSATSESGFAARMQQLPSRQRGAIALTVRLRLRRPRVQIR